MAAQQKKIADPRTEGEVAFIERHLVKTVSKPDLLTFMREVRAETEHQAIAAFLTDMIREVDSGRLDG